MLIVCPNCASAYQVSAASIGAAGRPVRCVRCRTVWQEMAPAEVPALASSPDPAGDDVVAAFRAELAEGTSPGDEIQPIENQPDEPASAESTPVVEIHADSDLETAPGPVELETSEAPPLAPVVAPPVEAGADIEATASRRVRVGGGKRRKLPKGPLPGVIAALVITLAALVGFRGTVVRTAPQMASLYRAIGLSVNLRGLAFKEIQVARDTHDGVPVLIVEGIVASAASVPIEVPRLRFALQNEAGAEVYSWTAMPAQEVLQPGETMPFRSRLASPPSEGRTVMVRFFTHGDAIAGLR